MTGNGGDDDGAVRCGDERRRTDENAKETLLACYGCCWVQGVEENKNEGVTGEEEEKSRFSKGNVVNSQGVLGADSNLLGAGIKSHKTTLAFKS